MARRQAAGPRRRVDHLHVRVRPDTPKGVAVTHRSAAAFVDAEAQMFLTEATRSVPSDRVLAPGCRSPSTRPARRCGWPGGYGACLVPAPRSLVRSGMDLGPWLVSRDITVVSTVPTLAALWPAEALEAVRLLIFGGEACPPELAERLAVGRARGLEHLRPHRGDRRGLRGTARRQGPRQHRPAAARLGAGRRGQGRAKPWCLGGIGELVIGGVGLARYLDTGKDAEKCARDAGGAGMGRGPTERGPGQGREAEGLLFQGAKPTSRSRSVGARIELGEVVVSLTMSAYGNRKLKTSSHSSYNNTQYE